jgi:hypothetical protein
MASKSRRKRKHSLQSKKRKRRDIATAAVAPQQVVAPTYQPAAPAVKEPAPTIVHHPHIGTELRRIGMLAAILLTTLAVLASVLS